MVDGIDADPGLERGALGDEARGVLGDRPVGVGRAAGRRARTARRRSRPARRSRRRAGRAGTRAASPTVRGKRSETSTISSRSGSAPARCSSAIGGAGVQRQAAPAVGVGRRRGGRHHARRLLLEQRREAAEVGRREADVRALRRAARARSGRRTPTGSGRWGGEELGADEQQRAVDPQVLPVVALRRAPRSSAAGWPVPSGMPSVSALEAGGGLGWASAARPCADATRVRARLFAAEVAGASRPAAGRWTSPCGPRSASPRKPLAGQRSSPGPWSAARRRRSSGRRSRPRPRAAALARQGRVRRTAGAGACRPPTIPCRPRC